MIHINFNKKIFGLLPFLWFCLTRFLHMRCTKKRKKIIEVRALTKAQNLKNYFISMRTIYHHQFLDSNLEINESTVKLLPAYASTIISDKFAELSHDGTTIRSVTDRVRNVKNTADSFELEAIEYFKKNPHKTMLNEKNKTK